MSNRSALAFWFCAKVCVAQFTMPDDAEEVQSAPEKGSPEWYSTSRKPRFDAVAPLGSGIENDWPLWWLLRFCTA